MCARSRVVQLTTKNVMRVLLVSNGDWHGGRTSTTKFTRSRTANFLEVLYLFAQLSTTSPSALVWVNFSAIRSKKGLESATHRKEKVLRPGRTSFGIPPFSTRGPYLYREDLLPLRFVGDVLWLPYTVPEHTTRNREGQHKRSKRLIVPTESDSHLVPNSRYTNLSERGVLKREMHRSTL